MVSLTSRPLSPHKKHLVPTDLVAGWVPFADTWNWMLLIMEMTICYFIRCEMRQSYRQWNSLQGSTTSVPSSEMILLLLYGRKLLDPEYDCTTSVETSRNTHPKKNVTFQMTRTYETEARYPGPPAAYATQQRRTLPHGVTFNSNTYTTCVPLQNTTSIKYENPWSLAQIRYKIASDVLHRFYTFHGLKLSCFSLPHVFMLSCVAELYPCL